LSQFRRVAFRQFLTHLSSVIGRFPGFNCFFFASQMPFPVRACFARCSLTPATAANESLNRAAAMHSSLKFHTVKDANSEAQLRPTRSRYASNAALNKGLSPCLFRSDARFSCT